MGAANADEGDRVLDGKTLYVVSDLHMGDGGRRDNFWKYRERFEDFLTEVVDKDGECRLILAGDVFELWQCGFGFVVRKYLPLLERVIGLDVVYIPGNHDIDVLGFIGAEIESPLIGLLRKEVRMVRGGRGIEIRHGHEFDQWNDPQRWISVGKIAAIVAGEFEYEWGTEIRGESTESVLMEPAKAAFRQFVKEHRSVLPRTLARRLENGENVDEFRRGLDTYHIDHPKTVLIGGHTHKAGWYGDWYVNCGAWQGKQAHYVEVTANGGITLLKWPEQEILETQLWAEDGEEENVES